MCSVSGKNALCWCSRALTAGRCNMISGIKQTSNHLGVCTGMMAILLPLQWVEEYKPGNVLICSDSVSVLKRLRSFKSSHQDILFSILQIQELFKMLSQSVLYGLPAVVKNKEEQCDLSVINSGDWFYKKKKTIQ